VPGNWPLFIGLSHGEGIVATVIGQTYNSEIRIFAAFVSEAISLRRHLLEYIQPWLSANAHRLSLLGAYEDFPNVQLKSETFQAAREILAGEWASISKSWEIRRAAMLDILTKAQTFSFKPVVQFDPVGTVQLSQALTRGVYEKDKAEKKTYHVVNAFSLLLARLEIWKVRPKDTKLPRLPH